MFEEPDGESRPSDIRSLDSDLQVTRFGAGALHEAAQMAQTLGMHKVLLVVDPGLALTEGAKALEMVLRRARIGTTAYTQISNTPMASQAEAAAAQCLAEGADGVISYGGGSTLDVGKAAAFLGEGEAVFGYGHGKVTEVRVPHIAIPTTAGTGAESSPYAFYLQAQGHEHTVVAGDALVPQGALLDPLIQASMPAALTAETGANALADAIEAVLGPTATDASDNHAKHAIDAVFRALPRAYVDGKDQNARADMALAAYNSGQAFRMAGMGLVDSISLVLSSLYSIGQSRANALVLPHIMRYQAERSPKRMQRLAEVMEVDSPEAAIESVEWLLHDVGIRETLHDVGLGWDDIYLSSHAILKHPFNERDPEGLTAEGLADVLASALEIA